MAPFELGIVVEVFALPRPELETDWWYELDVVTERPDEPLRMVGGMTMQVDHGLDRLTAADTVVIPAWPVDRSPSAELLDALREAGGRGARLVSICSGAFLLAATGLLDGRTAATHWRYADALQRRHPRVKVDPEVLYVEDPPFVTSAGSAAGIDACLHLIRSDHGSGVANLLARRMVVPAHRDGGQAQFIERPVGSGDADALLRQAMDWAVGHLAEPVRVDDLARRAFMAPRTFSRRFAEATGTSPLRWVTEQRVAASLPLLESSDHPVEHVAALVGFTRPAAFRQQFQRVMRTTPSAYRRAFRTRGVAG
jgi:AraC family transcriptional activator FtrA